MKKGLRERLCKKKQKMSNSQRVGGSANPSIACIHIGKRIIATICLLIPVHSVAADPPGSTQSVSDRQAWIKDQIPDLIRTYQWLHTHPEVSFQEQETANYLADQWQTNGFQVTTRVGGHGIVGIMKNGAGPTVMLRCDLDALPVTEQTQLPYASEVKFELPGGATTGVMHACAFFSFSHQPVTVEDSWLACFESTCLPSDNEARWP